MKNEKKSCQMSSRYQYCVNDKGRPRDGLELEKIMKIKIEPLNV